MVHSARHDLTAYLWSYWSQFVGVGFAYPARSLARPTLCSMRKQLTGFNTQ